MNNDTDPANWTPAERELAGCYADDISACECCDGIVEDGVHRCAWTGLVVFCPAQGVETNGKDGE